MNNSKVVLAVDCFATNIQEFEDLITEMTELLKTKRNVTTVTVVCKQTP